MRSLAFALFCLTSIAGFAFANGEHESSKNATTEFNISKVIEDLLGIRELLRKLHKLVNLFEPPEEVDFYLFTQQNPIVPQQLYIDDIYSVTSSNFNASHPTRFIIHGWLGFSSHELDILIRDAYLSTGPNNIIATNWISESVNNYDFTTRKVPIIGKKVGNFIDFLAKSGGLKPENVTIIGHSLGAHVAGISARSLKCGQVHTIIALDPAKAGFYYDTSSLRLRDSDAYYVESIQTTAATLGYIEPIGKAAFYPNGGIIQPNCGLDLLLSCAHFRSYKYFAEAIKFGGFPSIECDSVTDVVEGTCGSQFSPTVRMGDPKNADIASGVFFVPVRPTPPHSYALL